MSSIQFLIFDLDGTLIDSRLDLTHAVNATLMHYNVPPLSEELVGQHVGTGVRPLIQNTLHPYGITDEVEVSEIFTRAYLKNAVKHTLVYEGVFETLKFFKHLPKVILTNKANIFIDPILTRLELKDYFLEAFGRESFSKMKPDPEPVTGICKKFKVLPKNTMIVGDTDVDLRAGRLAGVKTCGVTYGFGSLESLKAQNPDLLISQMAELQKKL